MITGSKIQNIEDFKVAYFCFQKIIQHSCHDLLYSPNISFTLSLFSQLQFDVSVPKTPYECSTQNAAKPEIIYLFKGHLVLLV